jgi:predicted deacylase
MAGAQTRIATDIRFAQNGRQDGFLSVPISTNHSAYGRIQIPIVNIENGDGPRALLVAGNHGDEYEGQIALLKLARELRPEDICGRVTILSGANFLAVLEGRRNSSFDDGNLNRSFPGDPNGSPTQMIAHYIEHVLLPEFNVVLDLHSGGSSLVYVPCALLRTSPDNERNQKTFDVMEAFGAPVAYVSDGRNGGADRTLSAAAERQGVVCLTTELGGGGTVSRNGLQLAEEGVRRVLHRVGILKEEPREAACSTRVLEVHGVDYYVFSPDNGIVEPLVELEEKVKAGQAAAIVHFPDTPWRAPSIATFRRAGTVICKRTLGYASRGDCLYQIATDFRDTA